MVGTEDPSARDRPMAAGPSDAAATPGRNRHAYVFYATNDTYGIAVLVFAHRLRQVCARGDADLIVLHLPLSPDLLAAMRAMGLIVRPVPPLRYVHGRSYRDCLVKLRLFELSEYDRVVFVDADAVPLRSLDALFTLPFDEPLAAPRAYWLPQPSWSTMLLVAKPSASLRSRLASHFESASARRYYDMDIVNLELGREIRTLPAEVICLNSEWEDAAGPYFFGDPAETYARMSAVHFTALGKPWSHTTEQARRRRPHPHPIFYELWDAWWTAFHDMFRTLGARGAR